MNLITGASGKIIRGLILALILSLALLGYLIAQPSFNARVKNGFSLPQFDAQGHKKSILYGDEVQKKAGTTYEMKKLRLEIYENDKVSSTLESPGCLFDYETKSVWSPEHLQAHSADGQLSISGEGFEWQPEQSVLTISNDVFTIIQLIPKKTNGPPGITRTFEVRSKRFHYDFTNGIVIYSNQVEVTETTKSELAGPPMKLWCEVMRVGLRNGSVESILADKNVRIEQGETRASGQQADYSATNDVIQLNGSPHWKTAEAEGDANLLVLDRKNNEFDATGHTVTTLIGGAGRSLLAMPGESEKSGASEPTKIIAEQLKVAIPAPGKPVNKMVAQQAVKIVHGDNQAEAEKAEYSVEGTNALVVLSGGHPHWKTPQGEGWAEEITYDRGQNDFRAHSSGGADNRSRLRLERAAVASGTQPAALIVVADDYEFKNQKVVFDGTVEVSDPQFNVACKHLEAMLTADNKVKSIHAEKSVSAEQKTEPGLPHWKLNCDKLDIGMATDGEKIQNITALGNLDAQQLLTPPGANGQAVQLWTLSGGAADVTVGASNHIQSVLAQDNIHLKQINVFTNGQIKPLAAGVKVGCQHVALEMTEDGSQIKRVDAQTTVRIDQAQDYATAERIVFEGLGQVATLTGKPFLHVAQQAKSGSIQQVIEVLDADTLYWDRPANELRGEGPYRIVPLKPADKPGNTSTP